MTTETKPKMLLLHDYQTNNEVWCDPDLIAAVHRFAELNTGTTVIAEHTRIMIRGDRQTSEDTLRVSEPPEVVASAAGWRE